MNTKKTVLLLAATLLTAPVLVSAVESAGADEAGPKWSHGEHRGEGDCGHQMGKKGHHRGEGRHGMGAHHMKMDPQKFEQRLTKGLEKMDSPALKTQFLASQQARLEAMAQQMTLHRMLEESRTDKIADTDLKKATLAKIAADDQLARQKLKLMQDVIGKLQ